MALTGVDSIVVAKTSGQRQRIPFNRTVVTGATSAAGRWHEAMSGAGTGGSLVLTGVAGTGSPRNRSSPGALPLNADVSPLVRHLQAFSAISGGATLSPGLALLTDVIHVYPSCALTGTPSTMSSHPVWTGVGDERMTDARGVQCSLIVTTAGTAGQGQITMSYNDQNGEGSSSGPVFAPVATAPIGCLYGQTNTAVTVGGPYFPLAAGDTGVEQINSYTITTGMTTGVGAFVLHRPVAEVPLAGQSVAGMIEWILGERIYDDSCLTLLVQIGGAATAGQQITGTLETVWG